MSIDKRIKENHTNETKTEICDMLVEIHIEHKPIETKTETSVTKANHQPEIIPPKKSSNTFGATRKSINTIPSSKLRKVNPELQKLYHDLCLLDIELEKIGGFI